MGKGENVKAIEAAAREHFTMTWGEAEKLTQEAWARGAASAQAAMQAELREVRAQRDRMFSRIADALGTDPDGMTVDDLVQRAKDCADRAMVRANNNAGQIRNS